MLSGRDVDSGRDVQVKGSGDLSTFHSILLWALSFSKQTVLIENASTLLMFKRNERHNLWKELSMGSAQ